MKKRQEDPRSARGPEADGAWDAFYRTGKIEDYIRYAQMKNGLHIGRETDGRKDTGPHH